MAPVIVGGSAIGAGAAFAGSTANVQSGSIRVSNKTRPGMRAYPGTKRESKKMVYGQQVARQAIYDKNKLDQKNASHFRNQKRLITDHDGVVLSPVSHPNQK